MRALVTGAGGFIGGHLVRRLLDDGFDVRAVDVKPQEKWWQVHSAADNFPGLDLRNYFYCLAMCQKAQDVYDLACDMGGIGFIEGNKSRCMLSALISTHMILAAQRAGVDRYLYSSSACVYHADRQKDPHCSALAEEDAYYRGGAMPEDGYGWQKLYHERVAQRFGEDHGLGVRVARFHNIYGPHGSWNDGREKAPAAICRKVAEAKRSGRHVIDVWGDGRQTRSFCWIGDCVEGIRRLMETQVNDPINVGSSELVSIDQLIDLAEGFAGIRCERRYNVDRPKGVRGRNSDNRRIRRLLGWEPSTPLATGLALTYQWIEGEVGKRAEQEATEVTEKEEERG